MSWFKEWNDHDHDCVVNMVGWIDVGDSDWSDFKCQRAVHISSLHMVHQQTA